MPDVIPPSRSDLEVGQSWEVGGGVLMGLTSPNSPVIVGQEFSPRQLQGQTHLAVGFECRRSSGLFRFIIIRLFWCRAVSGGDGNKHSCAITKRNGRISHCVVQIIIQWVTDGSLPGAFDRCPLPICWVCLMNLLCPFREKKKRKNAVQRENINGLENNRRNTKTTLFSKSWNFES